MKKSANVRVLFGLIVTWAILGNYGLVEGKFNAKKIFEKFDNVFNKKITNLKFSFDDCGPSTDPLIVNSLSVLPSPIPVPGNITFSGDVSVKSNVTGPLVMSLKLIKVMGPFKVEIPCIDNFGSCTYNDVCTMLPNPNDCPPFFKEHSIPCTCPFPAGSYSATNVQIELDVGEKIPSGEYLIIANFQNKDLGHVACIQIDLNIN